MAVTTRVSGCGAPFVNLVRLLGSLLLLLGVLLPLGVLLLMGLLKVVQLLLVSSRPVSSAPVASYGESRPSSSAW